MEKPLVLLPLIGDTYADLFGSTTTGSNAVNATLATDINGYPLMRNHFATTGVQIQHASPADIKNQFSIAIQVRPEEMTSSVLVQMMITSQKHIVFSMEPDGNLSTRYHTHCCIFKL